MGGHNSYTFTGNASQQSYRPFKYSGELDSLKALRKEALIGLGCIQNVFLQLNSIGGSQGNFEVHTP